MNPWSAAVLRFVAACLCGVFPLIWLLDRVSTAERLADQLMSQVRTQAQAIRAADGMVGGLLTQNERLAYRLVVGCETKGGPVKPWLCDGGV